jgi:hypothetical protein
MRLISSLATAAAVLADHAADRLDAWVENTADTEAPRETPLGFSPATGTDAPDPEAIINAAASRGLAGEQRDRWLAEVKGRLDVSTGGPWCTEERDTPTGRIISPYGVIATGVTREADRDLIENARGDLYGMLALAEHDDQVIAALKARSKAFEAALADCNTDAGNAMAEAVNLRRELEGMLARERAVDHVLDSLVDGRLNLAEYIDPETPAGRVKELITTLLHQVRDAENGAQVQHLTDALHVANSNNAAMKQELDRARALLDAARQDGSASHLEVAAVMGAYDRGINLADIDVREDSLAERVLGALIVERGRASDLERKLDAHHHHDAEAATDVDAVRAAAAARIRDAAEEYERLAKSEPGGYEPVGVNSYLAGMYESARIAADETAEADPDVAHIDTVNGRGTLVTGRHGGRAIRYGGGGAGTNPPATILVTSAGYVRDVIEADDDRNVGAQVKHPDPLGEDTDTDER